MNRSYSGPRSISDYSRRWGQDKKDEEKEDESKDGKQKSQDEKKSQDLKKAESILDAIKNDEKVMQKQQIKRAKTRKLLKDW